MKKYFVLLFFFSLSAMAQFKISGVVKEADSKLPIPFAKITNELGMSCYSDIDGKFSVEYTLFPETLSASCIGYNTTTSSLFEQKPFYTLYLNKENEIIMKQKEATDLIQKVISSKSNNNPQSVLKSYECKAYHKLMVTTNTDSIFGTIDTVYNSKKSKFKIDSTNYKFKRIADKQHFFVTEKVSRFQYKKPIAKETVMGVKMAGFKEPLYELLGFNIQSFSIYDKKYELFETKYISPISDKALREYHYTIIDTVTLENRKTAVVFFKNNTYETGLSGLLYIDLENHAVAKALMRIKGILDITAKHNFFFDTNQNIWFPLNKEIIVVKGNSQEEISLLNGKIIFQPQKENQSNNTKKSNADFTYLIASTTFSDFKFNEELTIRKSSVTIEVNDNAETKPIDFWEKYRDKTMDVKTQKTYTVLDSIVSKENIERKIVIGKKIINGYLACGLIDLEMRQFLSYNNYEGFRIGVGGNTSELFSKTNKLDGYFAYGLKDEEAKYSLGYALRLGKFSNSWIGLNHVNDVNEIASTTFITDKKSFKLYDPRPINISTFYNYRTWRAYIETKIIPKTESIWQLSQTEIQPLFGYSFQNNGTLYNSFAMTTAMFSIQWNPNSDYMQTPNGKLEIEKRYPKFTLQFTKTIPGLLNNDFNFGKIDARVEYEKKYLNGQKSAIVFQTGYAFGDVPLTHLYNTSPNNITRDNLLQRITIAGKNSFETMFFNEFFSNEYVMLQLKHGFKRVKLLRKVKPSLVLVTRMAWGNMENPEQHLGINFKTLDQGFFESGVELNQIYKGFGFTGFYRYGPNQLSRFEDNLAIKLSFVFDFGF
jgi:hypothetical protein